MDCVVALSTGKTESETIITNIYDFDKKRLDEQAAKSRPMFIKALNAV